jgi:D-aminoacyl-tRNA deacylase
MIGLLQRVTEAAVRVDEERLAQIGPGLLVLVGIEKTDTAAHADRLLERLLGYRVFEDAAGRMNRSLRDTGGGLLLVPQFTLVADTRSGTRPGFSNGASPAQAAALFAHLSERARAAHAEVGCGRFGAEMAVSLTNWGPVTFWLRA